MGNTQSLVQNNSLLQGHYSGGAKIPWWEPDSACWKGISNQLLSKAIDPTIQEVLPFFFILLDHRGRHWGICFIWGPSNFLCLLPRVESWGPKGHFELISHKLLVQAHGLTVQLSQYVCFLFIWLQSAVSQYSHPQI